ncbi:Transcriptional regulator KdgR [Planctomycetes bacterium Pla163]|uniref:Transcriptional regulator KdgR n=1 Tax=Rohdeia mirabilis TaxID=2528008 RepID=A0A518CZ60_9BACT|nr:Transcriptional regulator KdgR [Planctomycetes bacterium Pla163]
MTTRSNQRDGDTDKRTGRYSAPALEKGLDILELLSLRDDGLSQRQLADALGRTVGEIYRMLSCLVDRDYVALEKPGDRYFLGPKLFELSHRHPPSRRLLDVAIPHLRNVARELDQSCHLVVPHRGNGVVVAQEDCPGSLTFAVRMGTPVSPTESASGRVLLAFRDERERKDLIGSDETVAARLSELSETLDEIRAKGFCEMESKRVRGIHDTSFPIEDRKGHAIAALTVPLVQRIDIDPAFDRDAVLGVVRRAARDIGRELGHANEQASDGGA